MKLNKTHIIVLIISGILLVILVYQIIQKYQPKDKSQSIAKELLSERDMDIIFGNDSADLSMYVYASYQCDYCRKFFEEVFPKLDSTYIQHKHLKVIYRITAKTKVPERVRALRTCVCINKYGNFTYLHKLLLANFKVMYTTEFQDMVDGFIEQEPFVGECIDGTEARDYLLENMNEFERLEFKGTPTFVIGNQVYMGYRSFEDFQKIINKYLTLTKQLSLNNQN